MSLGKWVAGYELSMRRGVAASEEFVNDQQHLGLSAATGFMRIRYQNEIRI